MENKRPSLDVIVPCYNPLPNWESRLLDSFNALRNQLEGVPVRLILVNDGSMKNVAEPQIEHLRSNVEHFSYHQYPINKGKGYALRVGVREAISEIQIFTDVDFPYQLESITKVYETLEAGADIALGFRATNYYEKVPLFRKILSQSLRWLLRRVLKLPITDTQCGLKGFKSKGRTIFLETGINRFLFDLEFVIMASQIDGMMTKPVLVELRDDVSFSSMNLRVLAVELVNFLVLFFKKRRHESRV